MDVTMWSIIVSMVIHTGLSWWTLACCGEHWLVMVNTCLSWWTLACHGEHWLVMVNTCLSWWTLACHGEHWLVVVNTGLSWWTLACRGEHNIAIHRGIKPRTFWSGLAHYASTHSVRTCSSWQTVVYPWLVPHGEHCDLPHIMYTGLELIIE